MMRIFICLTVFLCCCSIRIAISQDIGEEELSCLNARRKIFAIDLSVVVNDSSVDKLKGRQTRLLMSPRGLLRVDLGRLATNGKQSGVEADNVDLRAMRVRDELFVAVIDPSVFGRHTCDWRQVKAAESKKPQIELLLNPLLVGMLPTYLRNIREVPMDTVVASADRMKMHRQVQEDRTTLVTYERKSSGAKVELGFENRDGQVLLIGVSIVTKTGNSITVENVHARHEASGIWFPSEVRFVNLREGQVHKFETLQVKVNALNDASIDGNLSLTSLQLPEGTTLSGNHPEIKKVPPGQWMVWRNGKVVLEPTELLEEFVAKANRDQSESMPPVATSAVTWRLFSMQNLGYFCIVLALLVLALTFMIRMRHAKS